MTAATRSGPAATETPAQPLAALIEREFRPRSDVTRDVVTKAIRTLARHISSSPDLRGEEAGQIICLIIARLDQILTRQLNEIIHDPAFQQLEGTWRGLQYLVQNSQTSPTLKIRLLNVSKDDLARGIAGYRGATYDQSALFKRIYDDEFGQFGGEPYGCLIGDYAFDHSAGDVALLAGVARVAAEAHCPFIAAASPAMMQMESWSELANPHDLGAILSTPDFAAWQALRGSPDARYVALTLPRFAARASYGSQGERIAAFQFEEDLTRGAKAVVWTNAAYAMGANINRAFATYGWCSRIRGVESGGMVDNLPSLRATPGLDGIGIIPTETAISDRREAELSRAGFMPLVYRKNSNVAAFIGARTIHRPRNYGDDEANENSELSSRLPYVFAVSRFAHYLKSIGRDKIGSFTSQGEIQRWLKSWVMRYVDGDPSISSEEVKARRPLADADVTVEEMPGDPGYYYTTFHLRPHYQLEGLTVSLRLVGKMPNAQVAAAGDALGAGAALAAPEAITAG
ncbi:type VI secretion system contractile sheath large subunit [Sphingomonas sp. NPDC079357]|uniref:type VI secretion system contractile sheath large subunit n=1 Tax=Sphingomonas sp. NPDC079357 TaxID=3364518 RepID=UPI00384CD273